jgi:glycosyltransferase involved in cell wall biosynthesis
VVVISHNEGANLRRTVHSLLASLPADGEIVVVDDHSTDGSADGLRTGYDGVRVLRPAERLGAAGARNYGAAQAGGEILVFSDAHVEVPLGWLDPLRVALARPEVAAVNPVVANMHHRESKGYGFRWVDAALNVEWLGPRGDAPYPVPFVCSGFLALRREVWHGGFRIEPAPVVARL